MPKQQQEQEQVPYNPQSEVFERMNAFVIGGKQAKEVIDTGFPIVTAAQRYVQTYERGGVQGDEIMYHYISGFLAVLAKHGTAEEEESIAASEAALIVKATELDAYTDKPIVFKEPNIPMLVS